MPSGASPTDPRAPAGAATVPDTRAPGWSASIAVASLAATTTPVRPHARPRPRSFPGPTISSYRPNGTSTMENCAPGPTRVVVTGAKPAPPASCISKTLMPGAPAPGPVIDPEIVPAGDGLVWILTLASSASRSTAISRGAPWGPD